MKRAVDCDSTDVCDATPSAVPSRLRARNDDFALNLDRNVEGSSAMPSTAACMNLGLGAWQPRWQRTRRSPPSGQRHRAERTDFSLSWKETAAGDEATKRFWRSHSSGIRIYVYCSEGVRLNGRSYASSRTSRATRPATADAQWPLSLDVRFLRRLPSGLIGTQRHCAARRIHTCTARGASRWAAALRQARTARNVHTQISTSPGLDSRNRTDRATRSLGLGP